MSAPRRPNHWPPGTLPIELRRTTVPAAVRAWIARSTGRAVTRTERLAGDVSYDPLGEGIGFSTVIEEETELTGPVAARLFASSATEDADLFLILRVFDPEGNEITFQGALDPHTPVAQGWLRASHRRLDPALSTEYQPFHPHEDPEPLTPGEIYQLDIEIWPTSIVIPAGYTLTLAVQGHDYRYSDGVIHVGWFTMSGVGPFTHDGPDDRDKRIFGGTVTLHAGGPHEAYLLVPIIPS